MLQDFPGKQPNEKVIAVIRKHIIVYVRIVLIFCVSSLIPITVFISIWSRHFPLSAGGTATVVGYLGASIYLLYSFTLLIIAWINEEFDLFILTDHRLIDITQISFLKRTVATTPLDQIQDATSSVKGLLGTIMNYGVIDVQTAAGNASNFTIDYVHDPALVARTILTHTQNYRSTRFAGAAQAKDKDNDDLLSEQA